jgi:hypothetical protein
MCVAFSVSSNNIKPKLSWKDFSISSDKQDIKYVESTITEIQNLKSKNKNHIFLLGGDFNLPDIAGKISPFPVSFVNQISVPMMTSG